MFDALMLLYSWLPAPLNVICFGAVCVVVVLAVMRFIALIWDLLPFV